MEIFQRLEEHIDQRMKHFSAEGSKLGFYECCKKHIIDELLDIDLLIKEIRQEEEEQVVAV